MACAELQNLGAHARRQCWKASNFYDILGVPQDATYETICEAAARGYVHIGTVSAKMNKYTSLSPTFWCKRPEAYAHDFVRKRFNEIVQAYAALRTGAATDGVADTDRDPYVMLGVAKDAQSSDVDMAFKRCLLSIPDSLHIYQMLLSRRHHER